MAPTHRLVFLALASSFIQVKVQAQCPTLPSSPSLQNIATLPDPFSWYPAQDGRISSADDWTCRRDHIAALLQQLELGEKPPTPSSITATLSGNTLSITASEAGKSISFDVSISFPTGGTGPYPAVIAYGALSLPLPEGLATITFPNDNIAQQTDTSSRGKGLFYDLYGADHPASAMVAWAWGVSVLIDALELESVTDTVNIDPARLAVTGCSRNGKGALVAGAFDDRIALTIPQESGTGGSGCWRLADSEDGGSGSVQTARQIVTENVWFAKVFEAYVNDVESLPFDHHLLAGLIAPRALLSIDNVGYEWLGPWSSLGCMQSARKVWEALGVEDRMGYSLASNHAHCSFPQEQQGDLDVFLRRFLLGEEGVDTTVEKDYPGLGFDSSAWVDWDVPVLV
ncbi:putative extracelular cellulose binding protein (Cip2) [Aspergillus undulatus]|uniref:putative extracelular cellulose binding protein (Cip2) n=1 Tax=Aspergillus undulatus TaxID=1810928 RepID=UPI003CCD3899